MTLTGKCKEDFERWYTEEYFFGVEGCFIDFDKLPMLSMQYGVLVDFFDEKGVKISLITDIFNRFFVRIPDELDSKVFGTRTEARTEAIKKANELYNEKFK